MYPTQHNTLQPLLLPHCDLCIPHCITYNYPSSLLTVVSVPHCIRLCHISRPTLPRICVPNTISYNCIPPTATMLCLFHTSNKSHVPPHHPMCSTHCVRPYRPSYLTLPCVSHTVITLLTSRYPLCSTQCEAMPLFLPNRLPCVLHTL